MARIGDIEDLISLIFNTRRLLHERYRTKKTSEFSLIQLETLRFIAENKNSTMKGVADYLAITPPSATALIEPLVKSKKLRRLSVKNDRRFIRLILTPIGKKALESGFRERATHLRKIFEKLSVSDKKNLVRILTNISSSVK